MFCNCCGWFSVIGIYLFGTLACMLFFRNPAVIEHKFFIKMSDRDKINQRMWVMIEMEFVMLVAAVACFSYSFYQERK